MTLAAGLLACSNEVLTMIFNNPSLSKKDIKSLRLTSKELSPAATRKFARRYLTEPFFILSRYSLQSLVNICKHPVFGPQIRSIGFLAATMHTKGLSDRTARLSYYEPGPTAVEEVADRYTEISDYAKLCKDQLQLSASGDTEKLLLNALEAVRHPISITVTNDPESVDPDGVIGLPVTICRHDEISGRYVAKISDFNSKMSSFFTLLQKTITGLTSRDLMLLTGLKVNIRRRSQAVVSTSSPDCIVIERFKSVYSDLSTLHLDFNLEALRCSVTFKALEDLFKAAPKLQMFAFTTSCTGKRAVAMSTLERVAKIFELETAFKLKALVLDSVPCTLETLLMLMKRHKQTLVDIKLSRVTLLGGWKPCLSMMRKDLDLQNLHLNLPQIVSRNNVTNRGVFVVTGFRWGNGTVISHNFKGQESIHAGLDRMILCAPAA
jgi:hypothetical protein